MEVAVAATYRYCSLSVEGQFSKWSLPRVVRAHVEIVVAALLAGLDVDCLESRSRALDSAAMSQSPLLHGGAARKMQVEGKKIKKNVIPTERRERKKKVKRSHTKRSRTDTNVVGYVNGCAGEEAHNDSLAGSDCERRMWRSDQKGTRVALARKHSRKSCESEMFSATPSDCISFASILCFRSAVTALLSFLSFPSFQNAVVSRKCVNAVSSCPILGFSKKPSKQPP